VVVAGEVLAVNVSAGTSGFIIVLLLCLAAVGLFVLMAGSLRRLRGNVDSGRFGATTKRRRADRTAERGERGAALETAAGETAADEEPARAGVPGPRGPDQAG
jgi:hypothetical protein